MEKLTFNDCNQYIQSGEVELGLNQDIMLKGNSDSPRKKNYYIKFPQVYTSPPHVSMCLKFIDTGKETSTRLKTYAENITKEGFMACFETWSDSIVHNCWATWISIGEVKNCNQNVSVLSGCCDMPITPSQIDGNGDRATEIKIRFEEKFKFIPNIAVGFKSFVTGQKCNIRIKTFVKNVSTDGFILVLTTWLDTKLLESQVSWLAYGESEFINSRPVENKFEGGQIKLKPIDEMSEKIGLRFQTVNVTFSKEFQSTPNLFINLSLVDIGNTSSYRIKLEVTKVTNQGFCAMFKTWGESKLYNIQGSYVAHTTPYSLADFKNKSAFTEFLKKQTKQFKDIPFSNEEIKFLEDKGLKFEEIVKTANQYEKKISEKLEIANNYMEEKNLNKVIEKINNDRLKKIVKELGDPEGTFMYILGGLTKIAEMFGTCCIALNVTLNLLKMTGIIPFEEGPSDLEVICERFDKLEQKLDDVYKNLEEIIKKESIHIKNEINIQPIKNKIYKITKYSEPKKIMKLIKFTEDPEEQLKEFKNILKEIQEFILVTLENKSMYKPLLNLARELSEISKIGPLEVLKFLSEILNLNFSCLFRANLTIVAIHEVLESLYKDKLINKLQYLYYLDYILEMSNDLELLKVKTVADDGMFQELTQSSQNKLYQIYLSKRIKVGDLIYLYIFNKSYLQYNPKTLSMKNYLYASGKERGVWEGFYVISLNDDGTFRENGNIIENGEIIYLKSRETNNYVGIHTNQGTYKVKKKKKTYCSNYLYLKTSPDKDSRFMFFNIDTHHREDNHIFAGSSVFLKSDFVNEFVGSNLGKWQEDNFVLTRKKQNDRQEIQIFVDDGNRHIKNQNNCLIC